MTADVREAGTVWQLTLTFEAALPASNLYKLELDTGGAAESSAKGWFDFWTRGLEPTAASPGSFSSQTERYGELVRELVSAEANLTSVEAIQREIAAAMKQGATFSTAHKEGGTILAFRFGRYRSSDYGESSDSRSFADEASFFAHLREFYDWEACRSRLPDIVPEFDVWRIILRLMSPPKTGWRSWFGS